MTVSNTFFSCLASSAYVVPYFSNCSPGYLCQTFRHVYVGTLLLASRRISRPQMPRISIYPPQSKRAVLPSLGIPPTPVLHPPAPTGSPTQQGADTQFKALGRRGLTPNFGRPSSHWKLCEKRLLQGSRVLTRTFWSGHANSRQPG